MITESTNGSSPNGTAVLQVQQLSKWFGAVNALDNVSLELQQAEVLALLGDNGAGKSTLIKCINGVHRPDQGAILVDGEPVDVRGPADARKCGIETVYQDLALFDNLSPAANFFAGREEARLSWLGPFAFLRERSMDTHTKELLRRLKVNIPQSASIVGLMSGGQRQGVAVARAAAFASKVVILDEPTAALGVRESEAVLDVIRQLPQEGIAVLLISHNLDHVMRVAHRAVVMRRGRVVGEEVPTEDTHERLVSLIVNG